AIQNRPGGIGLVFGFQGGKVAGDILSANGFNQVGEGAFQPLAVEALLVRHDGRGRALPGCAWPRLLLPAPRPARPAKSLWEQRQRPGWSLRLHRGSESAAYARDPLNHWAVCFSREQTFCPACSTRSAPGFGTAARASRASLRTRLFVPCFLFSSRERCSG